MSTAIKVSEQLAEDARAAAADADRSLTGQVEHWARLGKAVEPLFNSAMVSVLKRCGGDLSKLDEEAEKAKVLEVFERFREAPPYTRVAEFLRTTDGPLYEADPEDPGEIVQVLSNGSRVKGRFEDRVFVPNSD